MAVPPPPGQSNGQPPAAAASPGTVAGQTQGAAAVAETPTNGDTSVPSNSSSSDGGSNTGAIVGGIVGGVVGLLVLLSAGLFLLSKRRRWRGMGDNAEAAPKPSLRPFMSEEEEREALEDGHMASPFDQGWQWSAQSPRGPDGSGAGTAGGVINSPRPSTREESMPVRSSKGSNRPLSSLLSMLRGSTVLGSEESGSVMGSPMPPPASGPLGFGAQQTLGGFSALRSSSVDSLQLQTGERASRTAAPPAAPGSPPWNDWEVSLNGEQFNKLINLFYILSTDTSIDQLLLIL